MNTVNTINLTGLLTVAPSNAIIIGCGAVGSKIAIELTKLGIAHIDLYDNDIVESKNICNQAFQQADIGEPKVEALKRLIQSHGLDQVDTHNELFTTQKVNAASIVFLCVDSMSTRRSIMQRISREATVIETRMGIDEFRVYTIRNGTDYRQWCEYSAYDDNNAETSACGTSLAVGATSSLTAAMAVWQYMKLHMDCTPEFEIIMTTKPAGMLVNQNS